MDLWAPRSRPAVPELFHQPTQLDNRQLVFLPALQVADGGLRVLFSHRSAQVALVNAQRGQERAVLAAERHAGCNLALRCRSDRTRA